MALASAEPNRFAARSFVPTVSIAHKRKRLELVLSILGNPVVIQDIQQRKAVVRGTVAIISRQIQRAREVTLQLTGTTALTNAQQMGGSTTSTHTFFKLEQTLSQPMLSSKRHSHSHSHNCNQYAVGTYTVPFEFVLEEVYLLPMTLHVPKCTVDYAITATATAAKAPASEIRPKHGLLGAVSRLWPFGPRAVRAQAGLALVRYPPIGDPGTFVACIQPDTRTGVLCVFAGGDSALVYRVRMQANAAAPGDGIGFLLDIFMSAATPKTSGALSSSSAGSSSSSSNGHNSYSRGISTNGNTSIEPNRSHHAIGSRCYKVRAQLVQKVRYLTNHDLVADANDDVYMFWTKRVVAEEKVADILDLAATVDELQTTHVQWTLAVPHDAQGSLQSKEIQVQYDVYVDFFPLRHEPAGFSARGMLESIIAKPGSHPVSCKLPLLIMPVPVSALLASPPVYAAD